MALGKLYFRVMASGHLVLVLFSLVPGYSLTDTVSDGDTDSQCHSVSFTLTLLSGLMVTPAVSVTVTDSHIE